MAFGDITRSCTPTQTRLARLTAVFLVNDSDRLDPPVALRALKVSFVSTGDGLFDLTAEICGFIGRPSEQKESWGGHGADGR
jgi:hypothetical protein